MELDASLATFVSNRRSRPALYDSVEVQGTDEVCRTIRIVHADGSERPLDASQERCLEELCRRLKEARVPER